MARRSRTPLSFRSRVRREPDRRQEKSRDKKGEANNSRGCGCSREPEQLAPAAPQSMMVTGCLQKGTQPGETTIIGADGKSYDLRSENVKLAQHIGHQVTVTGTASSETKAEEKREGSVRAGGKQRGDRQFERDRLKDDQQDMHQIDFCRTECRRGRRCWPFFVGGWKRSRRGFFCK